MSGSTAVLQPLADVTHDQAKLKSRILEIQRDKNLSAAEKAKAVQQLMTIQYRAQVEKETEVRRQEVTQEELKALKPCFHDEEKKILGCKHYRRSNKMQAKCCGQFVVCRFCHDEKFDHPINRYATETISCMKCFTVQPVSNKCINNSCGVQFAKYFCSICKFWDDDPSKDIYHCHKCNICRIGKGLGIDYFHCDRCNACMSISLKDDHKCVERSLESNCPICSEYMFTSTTPVMFLPCGHCMHVACYEEYTMSNYTCPICCKSLGDMTSYFQRIDDLLLTESLPPEYEDWVSDITCCDCDLRSTTLFHFVYHKCTHCMSYNTKLIRSYRSLDEKLLSELKAMLRRPRERDEDDGAENQQELFDLEIDEENSTRRSSSDSGADLEFEDAMECDEEEREGAGDGITDYE